MVHSPGVNDSGLLPSKLYGQALRSGLHQADLYGAAERFSRILEEFGHLVAITEEKLHFFLLSRPFTWLPRTSAS
nr:protein of unknown function [Cupriavidus taiwanensis]